MKLFCKPRVSFSMAIEATQFSVLSFKGITHKKYGNIWELFPNVGHPPPSLLGTLSSKKKKLGQIMTIFGWFKGYFFITEVLGSGTPPPGLFGNFFQHRGAMLGKIPNNPVFFFSSWGLPLGEGVRSRSSLSPERSKILGGCISTQNEPNVYSTM